jgi:hypothetical protein
MNHWCHAYGTKVTRVTRLEVNNLPALDLQQVAFPGYQFIQDRVHEETDEKPGNEASNDDDGKGSLGV